MKHFRNEIEILEENKMDFKIKYFDGYMIKKTKLPSSFKDYFNRGKKIKKCKLLGLGYTYFIHVPNNTLFIFTECPINDINDDFEYNSKRDSIYVVMYNSPQAFMHSILGEFYRDSTIKNDLFEWDEFGYFTTTSKAYNRLSIVLVIKKLRSDRSVYREEPIRIRKLPGFTL